MFAKAFLKLALASALLSAAAVASLAQGAREALAAFPDSQAVVYVDARRVLNEALPKVVPAEVLDKLFSDVKQKSGFDLRSVQFVGVGVRYKEPFSPTTPPDVVGVVKGDINATALMSLLRMAGQGKTTEETYKGRTLTVVNLAQLTGGGEGKPSGSPYPELAVVSPDSNTIIFGIPSYVRAAIDAADGGQRLRADLLDLATRNPNNLLSFAGDIPSSLADMLRSTGMPQNDEVTRIVRSLKQTALALSMSGEDFGLQSITRTDNADTARGLNGMITIGLGLLRASIEDKAREASENPARAEETRSILNFLSSIKNTATDNELQIEASIPQATVAALVKKEMEKQQRREEERKAAVSAGKLPVVKAPAPRPRRRTRRRSH